MQYLQIAIIASIVYIMYDNLYKDQKQTKEKIT